MLLQGGRVDLRPCGCQWSGAECAQQGIFVDCGAVPSIIMCHCSAFLLRGKGNAEKSHARVLRGGGMACRFCRTRFFSDSELFIHMQSAHEQCFLCRRAHPDRYIYYKDYNELEGNIAPLLLFLYWLQDSLLSLQLLV